jgi:hypothetical protein
LALFCSLSLEHTFAEKGETRRLDGHKEPSAPQNAPNIVKHTASRS